MSALVLWASLAIGQAQTVDLAELRNLDLDADGTPDAAAVQGRQRPDLPSRIDLPLTGTASTITLTWTALGPVSDGSPVGLLELAYADGGRHTTRIVIGDQVAHQDRPATGPRTPLVAHDTGTVSRHHWVNPRPDAPLARLSLLAQGHAGALALLELALTAEPPPGPALVGPPADAFALDLGPGAVLPQPLGTSIEAPAGARGFVGVADGHFVYEDGTRARFWGINLLTQACAPPKDHAEILARHLAEAGFNLVRLHHCDGPRSGIVNPKRKGPEDPLFDAEGLDRYDYLVNELKKQGLYVFLEAATLRALTAADGPLTVKPGVPNGHKLLPMVDPAWRDAYLDWTRAWLGRTNPYTGLSYAEDPAVAVVELSNEHSLSVAWGTGSLERLAPEHRALLDTAWNAWLVDRYPSDDALAAAWSGSVHPGLQPGETLGAVAREPVARLTAEAWPVGRRADLTAFYREMERDFYDALTVLARDELGFRVPLTPTIGFHSPGMGELIAAYDFVDTHLSWDNARGGDSLRAASILARPRDQDLMGQFTLAQLDKPFAISELNHPYPGPHVAEAPLVWATLASLQDWDMLVWLNYANGPYTPEPEGIDGGNELQAAAARWGQMPLASALFLQEQLPPAPGLWVRYRSPAAVEAQVSGRSSPTFPETRDVGFLLAHQLREHFGDTPPDPDVPGTPGDHVGWWPGAELMVLDTPSVRARIGPPTAAHPPGQGEGGGPTAARGLETDLDGWAVVSLASMDGEALGEGPALLTVAGRTWNSDLRVDPAQATVETRGGHASVTHRPGGTVTVAWPHKPQVRALFPDGTTSDPLPVAKARRGHWTLTLDDAGETLWWEIR